ncbi:MAG: hypothetical protein B7Z66_10325 [Chromatiales bacterium 21-64-14]|nr:MAG: hypothetical protein B7Z66_10325 [Chromatiales bacterium 21-64-14]HQU16408.1 EAL domain-containing protein [Gammaproteobacteria bacterium]
MRRPWQSFRGRFLVTAGVVMLALLALSLYTDARVRSQARDNLALVRNHAYLQQTVHVLRGQLRGLESALRRYAVRKDPYALPGLERRLNGLQQGAQRLVDPPFGVWSPEIRTLLAESQDLLDQIDHRFRGVLEVLPTPELRRRAAAITRDGLAPANRDFLQALQRTLAEARGSERGGSRVRRMRAQLRADWQARARAVQAFAARLSGAAAPQSRRAPFPDHRGANRHRVQADLDALYGPRRAGLDHPAGAGYVALQTAQRRYDAALAALLQLWRRHPPVLDSRLLQQRVQPLLTRTRGLFDVIERRSSAEIAAGLADTSRTTGALSRLLWGYTLLGLLLFAAAYRIFDRRVRRPLRELTHAIDADGRGGASLQTRRPPLAEAEQVLSAFGRMKEQAQMRQRRLQAILDHVRDGILTLTEHGAIETFNRAAQTLFGYRAEEAVGRNFAYLLAGPGPFDPVACLASAGGSDCPGQELSLEAQRKDGRRFPLSLKLSEMMVDGQRCFTAIVADVSGQQQMVQRLTDLAEHDSLTGLYNRYYFMEELVRVFDQAVRSGAGRYALLYLDLDNFKYVNDTLGHHAGDHLMVEVGALLRERVRSSDLLARVGGDEFAVLLCDVDEDTSLRVAESYRLQLADYVFDLQGARVDVGCSIGVAPFTERVETKEEWLAHADIACHAAKRLGRNRVHVFRGADRENVAEMTLDIGWARRIKRAIDENRFAIACQPIVAAGSGVVHGYEVLLRMLGDNDEVILPAGFLASAERFGLMTEIDKWVVRNAISTLAEQRSAGGDVRYSLNLSAASINDLGARELIIREVQRSAVDPAALTFEITETVAIADLTVAAQFLSSLRALGCTTALDDFGVGYSSFTYLKDLPVDYVKIDGSFVRTMDTDPVNLTVVRSMNEVAHAMGKKTVAEFVESQQILHLLQEIGVDYAQGFYLGRPDMSFPCRAVARSAGVPGICPT